MSIHFLLKLPYDCSEDLLEKSYKKKIIELHPDRSKKNTLDQYYEIRKAYNKYKNNLLDDNFYLQCFIEDVDTLICRCGTYFDRSNLVHDRIECETCSCFIIVCPKIKLIQN
ncbi:uncharacterized protein VNE69_05247 [Vairimorpha necatrix]|uniref:J domain-containing protein n=1 Tax=Vairimorpha necatrix TaxID=6039 RepID=A0AAX4JCT0_9MICR